MAEGLAEKRAEGLRREGGLTMAPKELPPQIGEIMLRRGAVIVFGPEYLENSLLMLQEMKEALASKAVLSCEKIDDLRIPSEPMLNCLMIFFHRAPPHMTFASWESALLEGVGTSTQVSKVEFVPMGGERDMQMILTWLRPVKSDLCVQTARAIERAYRENGGHYPKPGVFTRLRNLFS